MAEQEIHVKQEEDDFGKDCESPVNEGKTDEVSDEEQKQMHNKEEEGSEEGEQSGDESKQSNSDAEQESNEDEVELAGAELEESLLEVEEDEEKVAESDDDEDVNEERDESGNSSSDEQSSTEAEDDRRKQESPPPKRQKRERRREHHTPRQNRRDSIQRQDEVEHFFKNARFFLIKSGNSENVSLSKAKGVWATTPRNEDVLNSAFNSTRNVILVFSVERSQAFQGLLGFARICARSSYDGSPVNWVLPPGMSSRALGGVFKLDWLCRRPLDFHDTINLRNPWNENKAVKIGRDGTEIMPEVGRKLCCMFPADKTLDLVHIKNKVRKLGDRNKVDRTLQRRPPYERRASPKRERGRFNGGGSRVSGMRLTGSNNCALSSRRTHGGSRHNHNIAVAPHSQGLPSLLYDSFPLPVGILDPVRPQGHIRNDRRNERETSRKRHRSRSPRVRPTKSIPKVAYSRVHPKREGDRRRRN